MNLTKLVTLGLFLSSVDAAIGKDKAAGKAQVQVEEE